MILYPEIIRAEAFENGDIVLVFADKKTAQEHRFYLTNETALLLANAIKKNNIDHKKGELLNVTKRTN